MTPLEKLNFILQNGVLVNTGTRPRCRTEGILVLTAKALDNEVVSNLWLISGMTKAKRNIVPVKTKLVQERASMHNADKADSNGNVKVLRPYCTDYDAIEYTDVARKVTPEFINEALPDNEKVQFILEFNSKVK